eukprot:8084857-Lingulodinium_polyedra.AAC.1
MGGRPQATASSAEQLPVPPAQVAGRGPAIGAVGAARRAICWKIGACGHPRAEWPSATQRARGRGRWRRA